MYGTLRSRAWIAALGMLVLTACAPTHVTGCSDAIDPNSPVLSNGFAFNLSNTGNNASLINSTNVANLKLALRDAASGVSERRGAPAMTQQAVFFGAGLNVVAMNRISGCQYWSYTLPDRRTIAGSNAVRSSAIYYLNEKGSRPALILVGDFYANFTPSPPRPASCSGRSSSARTKITTWSPAAPSSMGAGCSCRLPARK